MQWEIVVQDFTCINMPVKVDYTNQPYFSVRGFEIFVLVCLHGVNIMRGYTTEVRVDHILLWCGFGSRIQDCMEPNLLFVVCTL